MTPERFNDLILLIDDQYRCLKPLVCETYLEDKTPKEDMPTIIHIPWAPCSLINELCIMGFRPSVFPDTSETIELWVRDTTIHYHSTLKD